jgi:hypothetical protein
VAPRAAAARRSLRNAAHCTKVTLLMSRRLGSHGLRGFTPVKAALPMSITTLELQRRRATQGGGPTPSQRAEIRAHPHRSIADAACPRLRRCAVARSAGAAR